jgi:hypothetical protein
MITAAVAIVWLLLAFEGYFSPSITVGVLFAILLIGYH